MQTVTYEQFKKSLFTAGFAPSEKQTDRSLRILFDQLDGIRIRGQRIKLPGFAVLKSVTKPARTNVRIGARVLNIPARTRFVFTPVKAAVKHAAPVFRG